MKIYNDEIELSTRGEVDILDITSQVQKILDKWKLKNGIVSIFSVGSTAAITTIEYEPGLLADFPNALERLFPKGIKYEHEKRWHDGNGHSHVRSAFLGPSLTVPFTDGRLQLGTWQQIVFVELDIHPRRRKVVIQLMGE